MRELQNGESRVESRIPQHGIWKIRRYHRIAPPQKKHFFFKIIANAANWLIFYQCYFVGLTWLRPEIVLISIHPPRVPIKLKRCRPITQTLIDRPSRLFDKFAYRVACCLCVGVRKMTLSRCKPRFHHSCHFTRSSFGAPARISSIS